MADLACLPGISGKNSAVHHDGTAYGSAQGDIEVAVPAGRQFGPAAAVGVIGDDQGPWDESAETVCRHVGEPENVGTDDFAPVLVNNARKRDPYAQDPVTWDPAPVRKFPQAAAQFPVPVQRIGKDHFLPYILQDFSLQVCQRHTDMVDRYVDSDRVGSIRFQTDPSGPASAGRLFTAALLQNPVPDHKIDIIDDRGHTQAQLRSYIRPGHFHPAPQQLQYICLALPFIL